MATFESTWRIKSSKPAAIATAPTAFFQEQLEHETRIGFLFQKLHRPRSYDYLKDKEKYKTWDDRLRMPQFAWANDPAAVEEVMTFVLGLTGEKIGYQVSRQDQVQRGADRACQGRQGDQSL